MSTLRFHAIKHQETSARQVRRGDAVPPEGGVMERSTHVKTAVAMMIVLVAMSAGMLVAACGSGSTSNSGDSTATTTEPIKIGVPVAMSGPYAGDGQNSLQGVEKAVTEINDAGGLLGRQVEIVKFDTQDLAPERVMQAADTLIQQEKVVASITGWAGWGGDVEAFGKYDPVPFFMTDAQQQCIDIMKKRGYTNIWMGCETEADTGAALWQSVAYLPYTWPNKNVSFVLSEDPWAELTYDAVQKAAEADGWTVVSRDKVPFGNTQWGAVLAKIRSRNPALIMFDIQSPPDMMGFYRAYMQQPTDSVLSLGMGLPVREFQDMAKGKIDGVIGLTDVARGAPFPAISEGQNAWYESFADQFGVRPGGLAGMTYTCTKAWAQAVEAVGDPTKYAEINTWLSQNEFDVWDGVPAFRFDADHVNRSNFLYFGQMQGGEMLSLDYNGTQYTDYQSKSYEFQVPSWIGQ